MQAPERDLLLRDPQLPGLGLLLDPVATRAALRAEWPEHALGPLELTYWRYKPGTNCLAAYKTTLDGRPTYLHLTALRRGDEGKAKKVLRRAKQGSLPGGALLQESVALRVFPNDRKLASLPLLTNDATRPRFLEALLPDRPELGHAHLEVLRYKPERRLVAALSTAAGPQALVKLYQPQDFDAALVAAQRFSAGEPSALPTPPLVGVSTDHGALAWAWLEAQPGDVYLRRVPHEARAVGQRLAALHALEAQGLESSSPGCVQAPLHAAATAVAYVLPILCARVSALADHLVRELADLPTKQVPLHGDFSADQLLFGADGPKIVDFDAARLGDPAQDLGSFAAQLEVDVLRGQVSANAADTIMASLMVGYSEAAGSLPPRIDLYHAAGVLRLVPHAFRSRRPDWVEETEALVARAEALLVGR